MEIFKSGQTIKTSSGVNIKILQYIGGGGQGEVYKVDVYDKVYALKWYYPSVSQNQKDTLRQLLEKDCPDESFVWPMEMVELENDNSSFGYVMEFMSNDYKSLVSLMRRDINLTYKNLIKACFNLVNAFHNLHSSGFCYKDISFNNIYINPSNGKLKIIDTDNIEPNNGGSAVVLGTPRFMAPEIVVGASKPNIQTDLHSLAVLLFYMLMWSHPLEGEKEARIRCLDNPAMRKLYGEEPVFIFDPNDSSNRPVRGIHDNAIIFWNIYPKFLKDAFTQNFTEGLKNPSKRIREPQWKDIIVRLYDSVLYCQDCGATNFYDEEKIKKSEPIICWKCKKKVILPPRLKLINHSKYNHPIMLNSDTQIFKHHLSNNEEIDLYNPVGEVSRHPSNPLIWGIKNLSDSVWNIKNQKNEYKEVPPGRSFTINTGIVVNFGEVEGEIRI